MLLGIVCWGVHAGTGGGIDILLSKGRVLAPPQRVLRGGGGAPYFRVTRGIIEVNRIGGGGGDLKKLW